MPSPRAFLFFVGFSLGLAFAACGSTSATCSATTCGGCCDATGKCQNGIAADACGVAGASCGRCGTGTVCQAGECRAASGTGGGGGNTNTGGGAGTGGGSATGGGTATGGGGGTITCRQIASAPTTDNNLLDAEYRSFTSSQGHYNYAEWLFPNATQTADTLRIEVVYPNDQGPVPPVTRSFTTQGYFACPICALFYENCDSNMQCAKTYLAQRGSITITRADRATAGRLVGSATNVRFNEWDLVNDGPVTPPSCVEIASIGPFNAGWPLDGGAPP